MQDLHPIIGGGGILGIVEAPDLRGEGGGGGTCGARQVDWRLRPHPHPQQHGLRCPRCDSPNTKFCYYNNYNLSQPRHYCKSCRRYWTKGGVLRNVPVGGGCRKSKRSSSLSKPSRSSSTKDPDQLHPSRRPTAGASSHSNSDSSSGVTVATDASDAPLNAGPLPDDSFDASVLMMMKSVDEASPAAEESSVDGSAVTLADGAAFPSSAENHVKGVFDYGFPDLSLLEVGASAGMGRMGQTVQADPPAPLQGSDAAAGLSRMDWQLGGLGATDAGIFDLSGGATETNHAGGGGCFWSDGHWGDTVDVDLDVDPSLYTFPE